MDFSLPSIWAYIVFGVAGFYVLRAGFKRSDIKWILLGALLTSYSYFVSTAWMNWAVGAFLLFLVYLTR